MSIPRRAALSIAAWIRILLLNVASGVNVDRASHSTGLFPAGGFILRRVIIAFKDSNLAAIRFIIHPHAGIRLLGAGKQN